MDIIRSIRQMKAWRDARRREGRSIGFVPTMGFLHAGHLSLCRGALQQTDVLVVSIFVNPTQFAPTEDLASYPRDEEGDLQKLRSVGTEAVFLPAVEEMYPADDSTVVEVKGLTEGLCGRSRPTHFKGVCTVVNKLFNIVGPDRAFFGLKDYQQYIVLKRMAQNLAMDVKVIGLPTVREEDGLARSSRNAYLSPEGRRAATVLSRALIAARDCYRGGCRNIEQIQELAGQILGKEPLAEIDYIELVDAQNLEAPNPDRAMLLALAVRIQGTRLIDNIVL